MSGVSTLRFLLACGKIKRTVRTGWTLHGVEEPESVAEHMYRMALISTLLPSTEGFNRDKCWVLKNPEACPNDFERHRFSDPILLRVMKMAIVHDLAECVVGDITPFCGISKEEKYALEEAALSALCSKLPEETGSELFNLWKEYESQETRESVVCKDLDKFEMILQAYEYEVEAKKPGWLEQFFVSTEDVFTSPCVREWVAALRQLRSAPTSDE